jgi:hypothetical protein
MINMLRYLAMMSVGSKGQDPRPQITLPPVTITTTLYDLIAAIQRVVAPEEDALAVATAVHMLHSGRARFLDQAQEHRRSNWM